MWGSGPGVQGGRARIESRLTHDPPAPLVKFCALVDGEATPYRHPDVWDRESVEGTARLVIGAASEQIDLLIELSRCLPEPLDLLYVLVSPRGDHEPGRYEAPQSLGRNEVEAFLRRFRAAFEQDGRHHVWIQTTSDAGEDGLLVYDENNLIYAYGPLDAFEAILRRRGLRHGTVQLPVPHRVRFHGHFDRDEDAIVAEWAWKRFPLDEEQDDV